MAVVLLFDKIFEFIYGSKFTPKLILHAGPARSQQSVPIHCTHKYLGLNGKG